MLTPELASCELGSGQGSPTSHIADSRAGLAGRIPGKISPQRLTELATRLARVQALGGEYARVGFSPDMSRLVRQLGQ